MNLYIYVHLKLSFHLSIAPSLLIIENKPVTEIGYYSLLKYWRKFYCCWI